MKIRLAISFLSGILIVASCSYDKELLSACGTTPSTFSANVMPLIQTRCATPQCHASGSTNIGGPFTNYDQIKAKASRIREAVETGLMPKGSTLTQAEINMISCWVESGAPNN
jgi:uncharacterized membrane protein